MASVSRAAKAARHLDRERLLALIDSITDEVWFIDRRKRFVLANASALQQFGLRRGRPIAVAELVRHLEILRPDGSARPLRESPPLRALRGEVVRNQEEMVRPHPNEEFRYRQVSSGPVKDKVGRILGAISVVRDITEHKLAEAALKESEAKWRSYVENAPMGVLVADATGHHIEANRAAEEMLGYGPGELVGTRPRDLPAEACAAAAAQHFEEVRTRGQSEGQFLLRRKDGGQIWAMVRAARISQGRFLAVVQDITQRRQAEEKLEESRESLRALTARLEALREQERQHLAREIHDAFGHALTEWKFDLAWLNARLRAAGCSGRSTVLRKIAAMSKRVEVEMESVRRIAGELRPALLDTVGLVPAIEWLANGFQKRTRIHCKVELPSGRVPLDATRKTALFRILQELLNNVARHAQARRAEIRLRFDGTRVEMKVSDDGRGISRRAAKDPAALGLLGIRERASAYRENACSRRLYTSDRVSTSSPLISACSGLM